MDIFRTPDLLCTGIAPEKESVSFVPISREQYLDGASLSESPFGPDEVRHVSLNSLLESDFDRGKLRNLRFLFFMPFSSPIPLATALSQLSGCHVLQDPPAGFELNRLILESRQSGDPRWRKSAELALQLLARTYDGTDIAVIRPRNCMSLLIARDLFELAPGCRALYTHIDFKSFFGKMYHFQKDESALRVQLSHFLRAGFLSDELGDLESMSRPEITAAHWVALQRIYMESFPRSPHTGIHAIDSRHFYESPRRVLGEVARSFGLDPSEAELDQVEKSPVIQKIVPQMREQQITGEIEGRQADYSAALKWLDSFLSKHPLRDPL
jgi:hypothetical protein